MLCFSQLASEGPDKSPERNDMIARAASRATAKERERETENKRGLKQCKFSVF